MHHSEVNCTDNLTAFMVVHTTTVIVAQAVSMSLFIIAAIIGNLVICYLILKDRNLYSVTGTLVFNLSVSDLCVAILNMPVALTCCIISYGIQNDTLCIVTGVSIALFRYASILTLAAISVDRYIAVIRPLRYYTIMTTRKCYIILAAIWLQAIICAILPLIGWGHMYNYKPEEFICRPGFDWPRNDGGFTIFILISCFILPFAVIITTSFRIVQIAKLQRRKVTPQFIAVQECDGKTEVDSANNTRLSFPGRAKKSVTIVHSTTINSMISSSKQRQKSRSSLSNLSARKSDISNVKTLLFVGGVAITCCSPYFIVTYAYSMMTVTCNTFPVYVALKGFTTWLIFMNSTCNPFIYGFINVRYRKIILNLFKTRSPSTVST